jgi:uncharacterized iron-regulated protein
MRYSPAIAACALLAGCASTLPLPDVSGVDVLLVGEQHDASTHAKLQERWVATLAARGSLAAVTLEMAERGTSTAALPADASESQVQQALRWNVQGWPWPRYSPAVMAAVRAGVPVLGANLPRDQQRQAMQDAGLDRLLPGPALKAQQQAVRLGHCELLPESQITPMTRVQIARDVAMAQAIEAAVAPGKTVVLLAGAGHVQPDVGVPRHLQPSLRVRTLALPAEETGKDYCEELRRQVPPAAG